MRVQFACPNPLPYLLLSISCFAGLLNQAAADDNNPASEIRQALVAADRGEHEKAIALLDGVIKLEAPPPYAYYLRGRELLRIGKIEASVADLDQYVKLEPKSESRQWERGIAYYYAGKFAEGAKQFEIYQTYHDQDVENSVWRYLCATKINGVEKARANMLPIEHDSRIPMMEVFDLFRGKKTPDDVFTAAKAGTPNPATLEMRLFYANLYVGLYYDSLGQMEKAREQIALAAEHAHVAEYMGDVARVHAKHLKSLEKEATK